MNAPAFGHNESAVRLGILAHDAQVALERVARGEADALDGWIAYGAALNAGRDLYPGEEGKRAFGEWVDMSQLATYPDGRKVSRDDRAAAMWAARSPEQLAEAREAGSSGTVRGIYAQWKEIEAEREAEARRVEAEAKARAARKEAAERAEAEAKARAEAAAAKSKADREAAEARAEAEAKAKVAAEKEAVKADKEAAAAEKEKPGNYRNVTTGENEWYTPDEYIALAREVMGGIDLDPASCAEANETVGAAVFHTKEDDGLSKDWAGRVWLNPPYSRDLMPAFCEKLAAHVDAGDVKQAILVSHNNTDTGWFHRLAASCGAICFPKRRIRFYRGEDVAAPVNGQVFFYFGDDAAKFAEVFGSVGVVMVPHE